MDDPEAEGRRHGKLTTKLRALIQRELKVEEQPRAILLLALSYAISFRKPGEGQRFLDSLHYHASAALEKIEEMRERGDVPPPPTTN